VRGEGVPVGDEWVEKSIASSTGSNEGTEPVGLGAIEVFDGLQKALNYRRDLVAILQLGHLSQGMRSFPGGTAGIKEINAATAPGLRAMKWSLVGDAAPGLFTGDNDGERIFVRGGRTG
jgi:hypothetical protein